MSTTTYVLNRQVHFGALKCSLSKGSKFDYIQTDAESYAIINGQKYDNTYEIELCIKCGFAVPYVKGETEYKEEIKISPRAKDNEVKKMEVIKSDADLMPKDIDISYTKNSVIKAQKEEERKAKDMQVIREDNTKTVRGMKVLYNNDGKNITEVDSDSSLANMVSGGDTKVIAKIGAKDAKADKATTTTANTKTAGTLTAKKRGRPPKQASAEAEARLAARKKQAMANHAKVEAEENKK